MMIDVVPVSMKTVAWIVVLCIGLPMTIALVAMLAARGETARWVVVVGALAAPIAIALLWGITRNEIRVTGEEVAVRAGFYKISVAKSELELARSRTLLRGDAGDLRTAWRVNGIGLPGYRAGWFKLRNGDRAFQLAVGEPTVAVPTTRGYWLMLSAREPEAFLAAVAGPGS